MHTFSVEIKSKKYVKNISISDEAHDGVLFEGDLGELLELSVVDDVFEFVGVNGVLRVGLTEDQLREALKMATIGEYPSGCDDERREGDK